MINTIEIYRFKNIEEIKLNLDNINVLVGSNNAGKSSILQAIQFSISIAQTTSLEEFRRTRWRNNKLSTSLTPEQILYTPTKDIYSLGIGGSLSQNKDDAIVVTFNGDGDLNAKFTLRKGRNKNLLINLEGQELGQQIRNIDSPFSIYVPGLAGIAASEQFKSEGIIRKTAAKGNANSVFRNVLLLLSENQNKWNKFHKDLNDIFPNLQIEVEFNAKRDENIDIYIKKDSLKLPIDTYGTGVLQAVQILSYLHLYRPKFLILDEPDSHLHPKNQEILARKLYELTTALQFQIILSTHSRRLLDSFQNKAKIHWISNGQLKDEDYNFIKVLLEIGALDKGDFLNNGNIRCIFLTEDTKTLPLETILLSNGFNIDETDIWSYKGCSKIDTAVVLAAFVKEHAPNAEIIIHRDSDYLTNDEKQKIKEQIEGAGMHIFFTVGTDIESNFLTKEYITSIYPEMEESTEDEYDEVLENIIRELEDKSKELYINHMVELKLHEQYKGGPRVNNGRISVECTRDFQEDPFKYTVGKKLLNALKNYLQTRFGQREVFIQSDYLLDDQLSAISQRIWQ